MSRWRTYMPVCSIGRFGRFAVTLSVLPALVLCPLATRVILIHDHHGRDTHSHALSIHELDEAQRNTEDRHEEHEHDGPAVDPADCEGSSLVILLDLSERLARGRVSSSTAAARAGSPSATPTNAVAIVTHQSDRSCAELPSNIAPPVRARGVLEGILLTSHALLL